MKVKTPALAYEEVAKMGPIVTETCSSDIPTFRLVPKTAEEMKSKCSLDVIYNVSDRINYFNFFF